MTRGRKPLPEGERMVVLAVRVPQYIMDWLDVDAAKGRTTRGNWTRALLIAEHRWMEESRQCPDAAR